jgi:hypothetical protein
MPPFPDRIYSKRIIGGKLRYREELIFREVCHGNRSLQDHTVKRKDRFRQPAANRSDDANRRFAEMKSDLPRDPACWKQRVSPANPSQENHGFATEGEDVFVWARPTAGVEQESQGRD